MVARLQSPEQELRFTRARQAVGFWLSAAVMLAASITLIATSFYRDVNPLLPHPLWALLPIALAAASLKLAHSMTRHAYVILTPLGIEIFPLFRPEHGLCLVYWQEIDSVEVDEAMTRLTLHRNPEKTSGVHLTLGPVSREARGFLIKALHHRVPRKGGSEASIRK